MESRLGARPAFRTAPVLREARPDDLDALERLELAAFQSDRLSRRSLRYFIAAPTTYVPVAEHEAVVAGYAMIGFRAGSALGRIFSLAVDPDFGRLGIGRALLAACEERARKRGSRAVRLEVRADNSAAIALYEALAYRRFGSEPDYYEDGATALRFEKSLAT
ncbi:GNAT family N-acetyltransferase [Lichenihabitans sp. PAMC28606]|uniref:GNAT family N-acetyltransferase n=1 Tax=Lichenihabitans sp. PAMC28606 TaxID=2880932 RepID=UPI001D0AA686|nr:GNAT family N-acetyltransferase [Lichenihabitans sp. PAMC28606]UDL93331.1 GNAT family N-acetyltransferase [Lichenihabitans sp. PAMC28606]